MASGVIAGLYSAWARLASGDANPRPGPRLCFLGLLDLDPGGAYFAPSASLSGPLVGRLRPQVAAIALHDNRQLGLHVGWSIC